LEFGPPPVRVDSPHGRAEIHGVVSAAQPVKRRALAQTAGARLSRCYCASSFGSRLRGGRQPSDTRVAVSPLAVSVGDGVEVGGGGESREGPSEFLRCTYNPYMKHTLWDAFWLLSLEFENTTPVTTPKRRTNRASPSGFASFGRGAWLGGGVCQNFGSFFLRSLK